MGTRKNLTIGVTVNLEHYENLRLEVSGDSLAWSGTTKFAEYYAVRSPRRETRTDARDAAAASMENIPGHDLDEFLRIVGSLGHSRMITKRGLTLCQRAPCGLVSRN